MRPDTLNLHLHSILPASKRNSKSRDLITDGGCYGGACRIHYTTGDIASGRTLQAQLEVNGEVVVLVLVATGTMQIVIVPELEHRVPNPEVSLIWQIPASLCYHKSRGWAWSKATTLTAMTIQNNPAIRDRVLGRFHPMKVFIRTVWVDFPEKGDRNFTLPRAKF